MTKAVGRPKGAKLGHARDLTSEEVRNVIAVTKGRARNPLRDHAILQISLGTGLRASEIAGLEWRHVLGPSGDIATVITLEAEAQKYGAKETRLPLPNELRETLRSLYSVAKADGRGEPTDPIFRSQRTGARFTPQGMIDHFRRLYARAGIKASSHSGRRHFITQAARLVPTQGGSIQDVRALARHRFLATTQLYIAEDQEAQENIVAFIGKTLK